MSTRYALLATTCLALIFSLAAQSDLSVLERWAWFSDTRQVLYRHLAGEAFALLKKRAETVDRLQGPAQWKDRQKSIRPALQRAVGPFPERTPLNPRLTGNLEKETYRVEKIIFESLPGFYVTAGLFLPRPLTGKAPAVLFCSGHSAEAFRSTAYQQMILNLVHKGFIVFAFDPFGQGERSQYWDPQLRESRIGGPTREHSYVGAQAFMTGISPALYMIWDGIRAIDYLESRPEVDASRIGATGRSGGGTQSAYIAAFDDRVLAVAPECYITSFTRLIESIGPQDAEQNFHHGIAQGIDLADLLEVRAPKPALMITTTRDFFSIQGARETYTEVSRAYAAFDQSGLFGMVEDDAEHASTRRNREAMYAFFQKHLALPGDPTDLEVTLLTPQELQITSTGQVADSLGGETVQSLVARRAAHLQADRERSRSGGAAHLETVTAAARRLSGYREPEARAAVFSGRFQQEGYSVERYFLPGSGAYAVPFLLYLPATGPPKAVVLYVDSGGKAAAQGEAVRLARQGQAVLAPDLIGFGETESAPLRGDSYDFGVGSAPYNLWFLGVQTGRSLVGIRAADLVGTLRFIESNPPLRGLPVSAVARGVLTSTVLHAAAFEEGIQRLVLIEPLASYHALAANRFYTPSFIPDAAVAGALTAYDLPDLAATLAPRPLVVVNPVDQNGKPLRLEQARAVLAPVSKAYAERGRLEDFQLIERLPGESLETLPIWR